MKPLEHFIGSPIAGAIGWAVLHSLWEGATIAALLGAILVTIRSPRVRYAAAGVAILAIVASFGITLARMLPAAAQNFPRFRPATLFAAAPHGEIDANLSPSWSAILAAIAPWLAPFWLAGVILFLAQRTAACLSVRRLSRRGVCCPPDRWQTELARLAAMLRVSSPVHLLESCLAEVPMVLGHFHPVILMPIGLLAGLPPEQVEAILLHELAHIRRRDYLVNALQRLAECLLFYHPAIWWVSRVMRVERENCCDDAVVSISHHSHEYALALAALERNRHPNRQPTVAATGGTLVNRIRRLLNPKAPSGIWAPLFTASILVAVAAVSLAAWQPRTPLLNSVALHVQAQATVPPQQKVDPTMISQPGDDSDLSQQVSKPVPPELEPSLQRVQAFASSNGAPPAQQNRVTLEGQGSGAEVTPQGQTDAAPGGGRGPFISMTMQTPYTRWLNEDVVYIVTPEERETFSSLTTNEERDQFIQQFWARRNPNPGLADNTYKDEHYRRIAYANQNFGAASGNPGWQTDRGHIYIVYGPPDELAVEASSTPLPKQVWQYNHVEGIGDNLVFTFFDRGRNGDYALAPAPTGLSQNQTPESNTAHSAASNGPRVRVGADVEQAAIISQTPPEYPEIARTAHVQGTVLLHAIIGKDGSVQSLAYVSGPTLLMKAALDAVSHWKYKPMMLNGASVEVDTQIQVVFTLNP